MIIWIRFGAAAASIHAACGAYEEYNERQYENENGEDHQAWINLERQHKKVVALEAVGVR